MDPKTATLDELLALQAEVASEIEDREEAEDKASLLAKLSSMSLQVDSLKSEVAFLRTTLAAYEYVPSHGASTVCLTCGELPGVQHKAECVFFKGKP